MTAILQYFLNLPKGQFKAEPGKDEANMKELLNFLKDQDLVKQYAAKEGVSQERIEAFRQLIENQFVADVPNGVFKADNEEQHQALLGNLKLMNEMGILESLASKVDQAEETSVPQPVPAQTIVHVVNAPAEQLSVQEIMGRDNELAKMEEIKSLYPLGLALTLSEANQQYIQYSFDDRVENGKTKRDYTSRMKKIIEVCGNRYLHELEPDDVVQIELEMLETPSPKQQKRSSTSNRSAKKTDLSPELKTLARSTVSERLRHLKAVYSKMIAKRRYRGENPVECWEALVSSKERKNRAAKSIRSVERVEVIFNGDYYAQFREKAPNMYLLLMTAIVTGMRASSIARLREEDLMISVGGTPMIDVTRDKTVAGVRQVPLPRPLYDALKDYLKNNKNMGFTADPDDNYASAISKANRRFKKLFGGESAEQLNAHDMRRSFNEYLKKKGVQLDVRSAVMGHSQREVNVVSYTNGVSVDESAEVISTIQEDLLQLMKFQWLPAA
jgi:integrase